MESVGANRGAGLDEDFVSHPANESKEEGSPHRGGGEGIVSDVHQLTETRLSDVSVDRMCQFLYPHGVPPSHTPHTGL